MDAFLRNVIAKREREQERAIDWARGHEISDRRAPPPPPADPLPPAPRPSMSIATKYTPKPCAVPGCARYVHWKSKGDLCGHHRNTTPGPTAAPVAAESATEQLPEGVEIPPVGLDLTPVEVDVPVTRKAPEEVPAQAPTPSPRRRREPLGAANARKDFELITSALGVDGDALIDTFCRRWIEDLRSKVATE